MIITNQGHITPSLGFTTKPGYSSGTASNPRGTDDTTGSIGFTTKPTVDTKPPNGKTIKANEVSPFIRTPLIDLVGRDPGEIYESILRKTDLHHSTNPYAQLPKILKDNYKLEIKIKRPLPTDLSIATIPDWFPKGYIEFNGIPDGHRQYGDFREKIFMPIFRLLHADHARSLIFTPEERDIIDQLHREYIQDLNLLGNTIEQALELYVELLEVKLRLHGITDIRFQKPGDDPNKTALGGTEIYYDTLLSPELRDQQVQVKIPEGEKIIIRLLQEKALNKALDNVSEILRERFFCEGARLKSENEYKADPERAYFSHRSDLIWDPTVLKPRTRILAAAKGIVPPAFLTTYGLPSTNIGIIYATDLIHKRYGDICINEDSPECKFLRPIYGYLHGLLLLIQENQMGTKTNYKAPAENPGFKSSRYYIRNPVI